MHHLHKGILRTLLLLLIFGWLPPHAQLFAQGKSTIDIEQAGEMTYEEAGGERIRRLVGNVILKQDDVRLYCDSALLYGDSKLAKAFGQVRIEQAGKFNARSKYLEYNGLTKDALLRKDVYLTDGEMHLNTQELFYNTKSRIARYQVGAVISNAEAILKSLRGTYDSNIKQFYFRTKVNLKHTDFELDADTLHYNNLTEQSDFFGPTYIRSEKSKVYTEGGWYKSQQKIFYLTQNGRVDIDEQQFIRADTIYFDELQSLGYCKGGVQIIDTVENTEIRGGYSKFNRKEEWNWVYDHPIVINYGEEDSLFLTADTIYQYKVAEKSHLRAWNDVVIERADLLVNCDSLSYIEKDSVFELYTAPVIWSDDFQITAEYMELFTKGREFDRLEMYRDGFLVKAEDSLHYSQIKGKDITAWFSNREISQMDVNGNGESIYYVTREDSSFMGANKIEASNIRILMEDNRPVEITFYVKPVGVLHPIDKIDPVAFRLKGFSWQIERKTNAINRMAMAFDCSPERGLYGYLQLNPVVDLPSPAAPALQLVLPGE